MQRAELCTKGTRVQLLDDILAWARGPESRIGFWLAGMAGTGKSTVARTIAERLCQEDFIVGSFFFQRGAGDRGTSRRLITTILRQLTTHDELKVVLTKAWSKHIGIADKTLEQQWLDLVKNPLADIQHKPIILIIDALDECEDQTSCRRDLIKLLCDKSNFEDLNLRLFITSRPQESNAPSLYEIFQLHKIDEHIVSHDIQRTLKSKFKAFNAQTSRDRKFPQQYHIENLVQRSSPLYIAALTSYRFITRSEFGLERRYDILLGHTGRNAGAEANLDGMYLIVIKLVLAGDVESDIMDLVPENLTLFKELIGSLVTLEDALSYHDLASLIDQPPDLVQDFLLAFRAVLETPQLPGPVRTFHQSFPNFLHSRDRVDAACKAQKDTSDILFKDIWIDEEVASIRLFSHCLDVMEGSRNACDGIQLKEDICSLVAPGAQIKELTAEHISRAIPPILAYACKHWVSHFLMGKGVDKGDCIKRLFEFLTAYLLQWTEAMSCLASIDEVIDQMDQLHLALEVSIRKYAHTFVLSAVDISNSPPTFRIMTVRPTS